MLWHWDGLAETVVKVILYLSDVDHTRGCMVALRHNKSASAYHVHHSARPWGVHTFAHVPKPWLVDMIEDGYEPVCLEGPTGTLVAFATNIVHRGSRPAAGLHRDFILFQAAAVAPKS